MKYSVKMISVNLAIFGVTILAFSMCYFLSYSIFQMSYSQVSHSSWSIGKSMPIPREEISGTYLNGKIYIVGGSADDNEITDNVDVYDPKTDEWYSVTSLPKARDHMGVSSYDGKLYAVGGFDVNDIPTHELLIYDPQSNKWKYGPPMATSRGALIAEFINGILYVVGGVDSSHNVISTVEAYDPQANNWTTKAPMPSARHHLSSAVVEGKLYAIGGRLLGDGSPRQLQSNLNDNEMYDPQENTWKILPPMPSKRSGLAATSVNSSIYVFGGHGINGTFNNNERFDTKSNTWSTERPMPTPRLGLVALAVDNHIYVIGGKLKPSNRVIGVNQIFHPAKGN
jgi:N-acetylneuraminic acid mutarotase